MRTATLAILRERRRFRAADAPALCMALREQVRRSVDQIADLREKRDDLVRAFSSSWSPHADAFAEGRCCG
jgi:hypothetical protein